MEKLFQAFFRFIYVMQNDIKKKVKMTRNFSWEISRASIGEHSICCYRMSSNVKQEKPQE